MASYRTSQLTKDRIYKSALLLFAEHGYAATSLTDIAKAAGVSTGTLYRYYPSKGDLLMRIGRKSVDHLDEFARNLPESMPLVEKLAAVLEEDLKGVLLRLLSDDGSFGELTPAKRELVLAYRAEVYMSLERLAQEREVRHRLCAVYQYLIKEAQEAGECDPKLDVDVASQLVESVYFQELDRTIDDPQRNYQSFIRRKLSIILAGYLS